MHSLLHIKGKKMTQIKSNSYYFISSFSIKDMDKDMFGSLV